MATRRLYRSTSNRMLFGVCSGLAEYFDVDPNLMRVLFVVAALLGGPGLLAYLVIAVIVPSNPALPSADRTSLPPGS